MRRYLDNMWHYGWQRDRRVHVVVHHRQAWNPGDVVALAQLVGTFARGLLRFAFVGALVFALWSTAAWLTGLLWAVPWIVIPATFALVGIAFWQQRQRQTVTAVIARRPWEPVGN